MHWRSGLVNLWRRPIVTTGAKDLAGLGIGVSGLVMVGPLELFMPTAAAIHFGQYVWLLLLALYALAVLFLVLVVRARLVVYNTGRDELRPILVEVVAELDTEARWAGDSVVLPQLGFSSTSIVFRRCATSRWWPAAIGRICAAGSNSRSTLAEPCGSFAPVPTRAARL